MKGEVPAKGTSPFFLIIIKFGTFFTHFEMILLYPEPVSYTHLRAHETGRNLVCRLLLEKKKKKKTK